MVENTSINKYGSWFNRLIAYAIDFIVVILFIAPMNYLNITGGKNFLWYFVVSLISLSYKPLLEFYYKKTLGKHFLGLIVNDENFEKINIVQAYFRNIFFILPSLLSIPFYYLAFNDPALIVVTDFRDFAAIMASKFPLQNTLSTIAFILLVIDFIFLFFDKRKHNRALHDVLAKTIVLQIKNK